VKSDTPEFLGYAEPGGAWRVEFPAQVKAWCRGLARDTGCNLLITIVDADAHKTRRQERGFHAMISPWAKSTGWNVDQLKQRILADAFGTFVHTDKTTGEQFVILNEPSTSKLDKSQYSLLIDRAMEIAANDGVMLVAPDEWRQIKEAERRKLARAGKR